MFSFLFVIFFNVVKADILTGRYVGSTPAGGECQITIHSKYYYPNEKHPLNERLHVTLNGLNWSVAHRSIINEEDSSITFDHNQFDHVVAITENGRKASQALVLKINHDIDPHPATAFTFIEHDYKDSTKSFKVICSDLKKI